MHIRANLSYGGASNQPTLMSEVESTQSLKCDFDSGTVVVVEERALEQSWLTEKNAVPVRLNPVGQNDENNCLACVA